MLPWQNTTAHHEREAFIAAWQEGKETVASLAQHFGVSRKTAHKFINRFRAAGADGLLDRSRAPRAPHNATPQEVVDLLIQAKREDSAFGPKKLVPLLRAAYPHLRWPAPSTAGAILDRAGLVRRRRRRRRTAPWHDPFQQAVHPNDCWCTDFKGWVRTGDGVRIDPLTIQDARSRYLLACQALLRPAFHQVRPVFERTFREYGLPLVIRSDNGPPFASTALGGLTQLAVWFVKLGVIPERIQPGHPEQNGRLERFHRTLHEETLNPVGPTPARQQRVFDSYLLPVQPPAAARGLGPDAPGGPLPSFATTLSPHGREPGLRRRRHRPPCPDQWRNQVGRRSPLPERSPHRRAGGACPTRRPLLDDSVRPLGDRPAGRPPKEHPAHPRHRVTHVTGLVLPMCPVAQRGPVREHRPSAGRPHVRVWLAC